MFLSRFIILIEQSGSPQAYFENVTQTLSSQLNKLGKWCKIVILSSKISYL